MSEISRDRKRQESEIYGKPVKYGIRKQPDNENIRIRSERIKQWGFGEDVRRAVCIVYHFLHGFWLDTA